MFNPTREQGRQLFFDTWAKYRAGEPLQGLETVALQVVLLHPEYHSVLDDPERFLNRDYQPEGGEANPFLHMSLHVAIEEQLATDQPPGIRAEFDRIAARLGDRHDALHSMLECLAEVVWRALRERATPDNESYLDCLKRC